MTQDQRTLIDLLASLRAASDAASMCACSNATQAGRAGLEQALARVIAAATRTQARLGLDNDRVCALALADLEARPVAAH